MIAILRSGGRRTRAQGTALVAMMAVTALVARQDGWLPVPAAELRTVQCDPSTRRESAVLWSCILPPGPDAAVHGLSGIHFDRETSRVWVAPDRASSRQDSGSPVRLLSFRLSPGGPPGAAPTLRLEGSIPMRPADGGSIAWEFEAVAPQWDAGRWRGLYVATEGERPPVTTRSRIYLCTPDGDCRPSLRLPPAYETAPGRGIRNNAGLEGLTSTPDGERVFAAVEAPLEQDPHQGVAGAALPGGVPRVTRILEYRPRVSMDPVREYAYRLDLPPLHATGNDRYPGISDMLAEPGGTLLVLERSYSSCGNTIAVYRVRPEPAQGFAAGDALDHAVPLRKELLVDLADERAAFSGKLRESLENFEGLTFGPDLVQGETRIPTLLMVTDDNWASLPDGSGPQVTALIALRMDRLVARAAGDTYRPGCPRG